MNYVQHLIREDDGQDVVEYGLLVATIGLVVLFGVSAFGSNIQTWFSALSDKVTAQTGS
jgi:Flp pilus assembly pilin Flp